MAYLALYRKYRPKNFNDVNGQDTVVKILKNSIINNKIGHAYVFSGPRGTGKTSVAKIFSRTINCLNPIDGEACQKCDICKNIDDNIMDIVEIDAASNNGVDEIREIRNNVTLMPSFLKYKVYIIDEVHMLSTSAFNALLKTLEEPPEHVVFILATTEINKVPLTVLSRCQKLDFKKISPQILEKRLKYIVSKEKSKIDDSVIKLVAEISDGSFRDALNYLDQLSSLNKTSVCVDDVYDLVGDVPQDIVFKILDNIVDFDIKEGLSIIDVLYQNGNNFYNICERLLNVVRDVIIYDNTINYFDSEYSKLLDRFIGLNIDKMIKLSSELFDLLIIMKKSDNQKTLFETYYIKSSLLFKKDNETIKESNKSSETPIKISSLEKSESTDSTFKCSDNKDIMINNCLALADKNMKISFIKKYSDIDNYISNIEYNSVSSLMLKATPEVVSKKYILFSFKNKFEVVLFDKNTEAIEKLLNLVYKSKYSVVAIDEKSWIKIKDKYINDLSNGIKYSVIDELKSNNKKSKSELEKEAINIFGDEIVTIQ